MKEYLAILEPATDGTWSAYVPDLPGLGVSAETREQVREKIQEVIAFHIDGLRAHGDPVPEPSSSPELISVVA